MNKWGILYFLTSRRGVPSEEKSLPEQERAVGTHSGFLKRSVESLRWYMKDISTVLFTDFDDVDWSSYGLDQVIYKEKTSDLWTYKYECLLETPFERTIHMDCDTYVCGEFYEVFEMLDGVDFAVTLSPWYFNFTVRGLHDRVPISFPEPCGGFMAYNSNEKVFDFLKHTKDLVINREGGSDEPSLRIAMYEKDIKFAILPWEYNCVFLMPGYILREPKILHGKIDDEGVRSIIEGTFRNSLPKLFTGESLIHCHQIRKRTYKMGLVEKLGHKFGD